MIIVLSILALVAKSQDLVLNNEIQQNKLELLQYNCEGRDTFADVELYYILEAEEDFIKYKKDINQLEIQNLKQLRLLKQDYGFNQAKECSSLQKGYRPINRIISYDRKIQESFLQKPHLQHVLEILQRIVIETNYLFGDKDAYLDYIIKSLFNWSKDVDFFLDLVQKKKISDEQKQQAQQAYHNCEHVVKLVTKRIYEPIDQNNLKKNVILKQKLKSSQNHKKIIIKFDQDLLLNNEMQQIKLELLQQQCIRNKDYQMDMQLFLILEAEEDFRKYLKVINSQQIKDLQSLTKSLKQDYGYNNQKLKWGDEYSSFGNKKQKDPETVLKHIISQTNFLIAKDQQLNELIDQISIWESDVNFFLDLVQKMKISDEVKLQAKYEYHNCDQYTAEKVTKDLYGSIVTNKKTKQLKKNGILNQKLKSRRNHRK